MTEREMLTTFGGKLREMRRDDQGAEVFWHKIADTPGKTGRKPFDAFAIWLGNIFVFEFKRTKGKLEKHQLDVMLKATKCGGRAFMAVFTPQKKGGTERHIIFYVVNRHGVTYENGYRLEWHKDGYPKIGELFRKLDFRWFMGQEKMLRKKAK